MTTIDDNKFEELCAGYVLGALSIEEEQTFREMLADASDEQLQLYEDLKAVTAEFAQFTKEQEPSADLKARIMEAIKDHREKPAPVYRLRSFKYAVAASFIFVFLSIGLLFYSQTLQSDVESLSTLVEQQKSTITELQTQVERREELLNILEARDVDLVLMDGLEVNPNGYGKVVWDKENGQALLQVANLPAVPLNKDYQLWFVVNNQPISAGVFAVNNPTNDNFFKIDRFQNDAAAGAFAITLEPEGGSPQPTGDMYMLGSLNN